MVYRLKPTDRGRGSAGRSPKADLILRTSRLCIWLFCFLSKADSPDCARGSAAQSPQANPILFVRPTGRCWSKPISLNAFECAHGSSALSFETEFLDCAHG